MTLEEKGPIVPPPVLSKFPELVSKEIQSWKQITAATHWEINDSTKTNGSDFYIGEKELGHIHLDGELHLPVGKELAVALLENKLAEKFPYGRNWVISSISSQKEVDHAIWLFKLNYKRIQGETIEELRVEIKNYQKK